jgi:hypothetical protein
VVERAIVASASRLARLDAWLGLERLRVHAALLALCLWGVLVLSSSTPGPIGRHGQLEGADFLQFYTSASLVREGRLGALYDRHAYLEEARRLVPEAKDTTYLPIYGPQVALVLEPLAALPWSAALYLWLAGNAALYALCVAAVWRRCPHLAGHGRDVALAALAWPACFAMLGAGQASSLALACFTGAFLALRAERRFLAGLALGSLAWKPQLGLAVAVAFVAARDGRVVAGALVAAAAQLALPALLLGPRVLADYAGVVAELPSLAPVLAGKTHQMHSLRSFFDFLLPDPLAGLAFAAGALATLALAARTWRSDAPLELRFATLLLATALASPHLYLYDLVILAPAWLLLADRIAASPAAAAQAGLRTALWAGFALTAMGPLSRFSHVQLSVPLFAWLAWRCVRLAQAEQASPAPIVAAPPAFAALGDPLGDQLGR